MTNTQTPTPHPPGATLHLGGNAWASPDLEPLLVPISTVGPYPGNPRLHHQDGITTSIRDHGLYQGVTVQASTGHVIVGNGRLQALRDLGATHVPRTLMDVDDRRAAAIVARDNRSSDLSTNDDRLLLDLLADLASEDEVLALAGYDEHDLEDLHRAIANLEFAQASMVTDGAPVEDVSDPIDTIGGDVVRITVMVEAAAKADLYALLAKQPWVRDVADAHTRKEPA